MIWTPGFPVMLKGFGNFLMLRLVMELEVKNTFSLLKQAEVALSELVEGSLMEFHLNISRNVYFFILFSFFASQYSKLTFGFCYSFSSDGSVCMYQ